MKYNKFEQKCFCCGRLILPQSGLITKINGRWEIIQHRGDCVLTSRHPLKQERLWLEEPETPIDLLGLTKL